MNSSFCGYADMKQEPLIDHCAFKVEKTTDQIRQLSLSHLIHSFEYWPYLPTAFGKQILLYVISVPYCPVVRFSFSAQWLCWISKGIGFQSYAVLAMLCFVVFFCWSIKHIQLRRTRLHKWHGLTENNTLKHNHTKRSHVHCLWSIAYTTYHIPYIIPYLINILF